VSCHNGKENPIGIETNGSLSTESQRLRHNGKENPIGIETMLMQRSRILIPGHNGKENPIGIETYPLSLLLLESRVTMEKKTR